MKGYARQQVLWPSALNLPRTVNAGCKVVGCSLSLMGHYLGPLRLCFAVWGPF